jgi:hypothetical protein
MQKICIFLYHSNDTTSEEFFMNREKGSSVTMWDFNNTCIRGFMMFHFQQKVACLFLFEFAAVIVLADIAGAIWKKNTVETLMWEVLAEIHGLD